MQQCRSYQFRSGLHCLLKDGLKPRVQSICSICGTRYLSKHWIREYGTQDRGNTFLYDSHQLTTSKHHFCVFLFKDPLLDWKYNSSVGHLPSTHEALHSIPRATHNKQIHQCRYLLHIVNSQHITLIIASENLIWHITAQHHELRTPNSTSVLCLQLILNREIINKKHKNAKHRAPNGPQKRYLPAVRTLPCLTFSVCSGEHTPFYKWICKRIDLGFQTDLNI